MNTSNTSNNNNNFVTSDFSISESAKPNNKKDSKSRNYKAIKKTEDRNKKVESLISELPNKYQKQLQTFKTSPVVAATVAAVEVAATVEAVQKKTIRQKPRVQSKTNFACEVRDAISDCVWNEHEENEENEEDEEKEEEQCEQMDEELDAWLTEERLKVWNAAYEKWIEYKDFTDGDEWSALTEDALKEQYYQLDDNIARWEPESNTRTLDEYETNKYEMDELRRIVAFKKQKAIEDAWLRTSKSSFTVESCIDSWYDMALGDAVKMNSANAKIDASSKNSNVVADAIRDAESNARVAWLNEQYDFASETDHLDSMDSGRFTQYTEWLTANKMADDLRYVTWSQQQYNDSVALDDSKYDELPLHERYTWISDDDSEEDV